MNEFDVVVIGGGPGGYAAGIRAAQLGLSVALVEREALGGTCLNWGCIPTKSLLHSAELYTQMCSASDFGINAKSVGFDLSKIVQKSRQAADQLSQGIAQLMKKNKIQVFTGDASIVSVGQVQVGDQVLVTDSILIATGLYPLDYSLSARVPLGSNSPAFTERWDQTLPYWKWRQVFYLPRTLIFRPWRLRRSPSEASTFKSVRH